MKLKYPSDGAEVVVILSDASVEAEKNMGRKICGNVCESAKRGRIWERKKEEYGKKDLRQCNVRESTPGALVVCTLGLRLIRLFADQYKATHFE